MATEHHLTPDQHKGAERWSRYLLEHRAHLRYPTSLASGWPTVPSIVEGACRHLIKDRLDIKGARWGLEAAEAILNLWAVWSNGDRGTYWTYHLAHEQDRVHFRQYPAA